MAGLSQWAFSICLVMVACGLAGMLLPKTNLDKMFKMAVSVFFLSCLLSPLVIRVPALDVEVRQYSQEDIQRRAQSLSDTVDAQSDEIIKRDLAKIIEQKLEQKGIKYTSITIHITSNGQNDSAAPMAEIELDSEHRQVHQSIRRELMDELGLEVRLGYG